MTFFDIKAVKSEVKVKNPYGFTLVEIMIVVAIISLLAAIAMPSLAKARRNSRINASASDLRTIYNAFQLYAFENVTYSDAPATRGVLPDYMEGYIKKGYFEKETPFGGNYYYKSTCFGALDSQPAIGMVADNGESYDDSAMREIDEILDDGNLSEGLFVKLSNKAFYYILE